MTRMPGITTEARRRAWLGEREEVTHDESKGRIPAGTWTADPVHSTVRFAATRNSIGTFRSGFRRFSARLVGGEEPYLEGMVEVASIEVEEPQLRGHLLSPDFFDVLLFRRIRFASKRIDLGADGAMRIAGGLTINHLSRPVECHGHLAMVADADGATRIGVALQTTLDRRDFDLDFNRDLPSGGSLLGWEIVLDVALELLREID
jgi:polyisoprenoid-binding protein YceI